MSEDSAARRHPEDVVAFVNALVVLLLPPLLIWLGMTLFPSSSAGSTVHADESFAANAARAAEGFAMFEIVLLPFAVAAGWRSWVHARRYRQGLASGWLGIVEAGLAGFLPAALLLLRATLPWRAPASLMAGYVLFYAGGSMILGLAFGVVLCVSALAVLRILGVRFNATPA
jgi:hypothetical protein